MAVLPERQMGARTGFQPEGRLAQFWKRVKQNKVSYLFVAPYGLLFFLFTVLPVGVAVVLSFYRLQHAAAAAVGGMEELSASVLG